MNTRISVCFLVIMCFLLSGCASLMVKETPDFYPNAKYHKTGSPAAEQAANECMALADRYVPEPPCYCDLLKDTLGGGVIGAGSGAIVGPIMHEKVGRTTGAGAAVGSLLGLIYSVDRMNEHTPKYQRFVELCLRDKGYEVLGWSSKEE